MLNNLSIIDAPAHAKFAPSGASRWLPCNASVAYADDETNDQAIFGTEVHDWVANNGGPYLPQWDSEKQQRANFCLSEYLKHVPPEARAELKLFSREFPDIFFGTLDAVWMDSMNCVNIVDLKSGFKGVNAKNNPQLKCYAVLASEHFPTAETFRLTIIQPARYYTDYDVCTRAEINDFYATVKRAIQSAPTFAAGSHCEHCPNRSSCSELHNSFFKLLAEAQDGGLWSLNSNLISLSGY